MNLLNINEGLTLDEDKGLDTHTSDLTEKSLIEQAQAIIDARRGRGEGPFNRSEVSTTDNDVLRPERDTAQNSDQGGFDA